MAEKTHLNVEGMTCSNCALGVTRLLEKRGLKEVRVDFTSGEVVFEEVTPDLLPAIMEGIRQLGYRVTNPIDGLGVSEKEPFVKSEEFLFLVCAFLTLPLLLHMVLPFALLHHPVFQCLVSLPVFLIGMRYFGKSALSSLKTGVPNMDVLITVGSSSAFFYSVAGMMMYYGTPLMHQYLFFETAATIITLVLMGNIIEKRSVRKTTSALRDLAAMQPQMARRITIGKDLQENIETTPVNEIRKNDPVLLNAGDQIPVDGTLYQGNLVVDESALTGESLPVEKATGSQVLAGSIIISGNARVVTEKAGRQTVLANIIELVKAAQQSKPEIQKLGDRVSAWFVPAVLLIALGTFLVSFFFFNMEARLSIMSAVAVLVISCPCAMGLATPTAVAVGLGKAARKGILIKGGSTLELFSNIKTAVFDKTGTLTTGHFSVNAIHTYGFDEQKAINIIYSLEQYSSHPIAQSLLREFEKRKTNVISLMTVQEEKGLGIRGEDAEGRVYRLASEGAVKATSVLKGHSVYLTENNQIVAALDLMDEIKPGASAMISALKLQGITPVLLSGDGEKRCREVAEMIGIDNVYFNHLPHEKIQKVDALKKEGTLLMVGDGINDAPSLASADIGISFSSATKIAINTARVVILNQEDLRIILTAIHIGKQTLSTIRQNLFWAFAYNLVAIPVAAVGLLSPMVAAFSMAFSDVVVIGNSLRLRLRK